MKALLIFIIKAKLKDIGEKSRIYYLCCDEFNHFVLTPKPKTDS